METESRNDLSLIIFVKLIFLCLDDLLECND
jgi:hypothetical protein